MKTLHRRINASQLLALLFLFAFFAHADDTSPPRIPTVVDKLLAPLGRTYITLGAKLQFASPADAAAFRAHIGATGGGGDLLAANNLSDLTSAATARTNLGLGTAATTAASAYDATGAAAAAQAASQPLDADLTSIASLATTSFGRSFLPLADAAAGRALLGLAAVYQPLDADLTSIAAISTTTFGRSLLTQTDAFSSRITLGLGLFSSVSFGGIAMERWDDIENPPLNAPLISLVDSMSGNSGNPLLLLDTGVGAGFASNLFEARFGGELKFSIGSAGITTDGGFSSPSTVRGQLGGTTIGQSLFTLANPSAIRFPRLNADNTASALTAAALKTAIGGDTLTTGRTIAITGDVSYTSPAFDGSGNVTAAATLPTVNSNVGTFGSASNVGTFTVNAKGLVTAASNATITPAFSSLTGTPTTLSGYGITDAQPLDSDLTSIAALATTSFGRSFLPLANAAAGRTLLVLGSMATQDASAVAITGGTITGIPGYTSTGIAALGVGSADLDWSLASVFTKTLTYNTTFSFSNIAAGKQIIFNVTGASGYGINWPGSVTWINGSPGNPSNGVTKRFRFVAISSSAVDGYLDAQPDGPLQIAAGGTSSANAAGARTNLGLGTLATQSGTFSGASSGTNTGDQTTITGNAGTATALATARTINAVSFDGTGNITVAAAAGTLTGSALPSGLTASSLTSFGASPSFTGSTSGSCSVDALGNFRVNSSTLASPGFNVGGYGGLYSPTGGVLSMGIVGTLIQSWNGSGTSVLGTLSASGAVAGATFNGLTITTSTGTVTIASSKTLTASNTLTLAGTDGSTLNVGSGGTLGSAAFTASTAYATVAQGALAATALQGNQTVTLSGDVTGSGATGITATLAASGVTAGAYGDSTHVPVITFDSKGRATAASVVAVSGGLGLGTVTSVSVVTANGVSGSVATATTTPAITLTLGAITPSSVAASGTVTGSNLSGTHSGASSGTNTGDQTTITGNAGTATALATARTLSLTGDVAYTSPGFDGSGAVTAAATLAVVNSNVGTFGSATQVPVLTLDGKGRATAASNVTIAIPFTALTGSLASSQMPALTGDITTTAGAVATTLAASGVTAATYGSATTSAVMVVDAKGRATSASNVTITPDWSNVANKPLLPTTVFTTSDVVNNNATANTIADITGLSFAVTAGHKYRAIFYIPYDTAATTTGARFSINGPASPTKIAYSSNWPSTATTQTLNVGLNAYDLPAASSGAAPVTSGNLAVITLFIVPSASGTVTARFASEVASSAVTVLAGANVQVVDLQ